MVKKLKLWNGSLMGRNHVYLAAYSRADARKLLVEVGMPNISDSYIRDYWSAGCWGNSMSGITPERGVWFSKDGCGAETPVRIKNKSDFEKIKG